jgi:hypothetical protein
MISATHDLSRLFSLHPARQLIAVGRSSVDLPLPAVFGLIADNIQKSMIRGLETKEALLF